MRIPVVSYDWKQSLLNDLGNGDRDYLENTFIWEDVPSDLKFEIEGTEFQEDLFDNLVIAESSRELGRSDLINAKIVYEGLNGLTPEFARDDRVWTALAHYFGCGFLIDRHVGRDGSAGDRMTSILGCFFAESKQARGTRALTRVHGLARLWWTAHTAAKIGAPTLEECLEIFGSDIDFRNQVMERPTNASSNTAVAATCLARRNISEAGIRFSRKQARDWLVEVNLVGGGVLLAAQDVTSLTSRFEGLLQEQATKN